jgi:hypothetical protein
MPLWPSTIEASAMEIVPAAGTASSFRMVPVAVAWAMVAPPVGALSVMPKVLSTS